MYQDMAVRVDTKVVVGKGRLVEWQSLRHLPLEHGESSTDITSGILSVIGSPQSTKLKFVGRQAISGRDPSSPPLSHSESRYQQCSLTNPGA
jgi:hypothetical protein